MSEKSQDKELPPENSSEKQVKSEICLECEKLKIRVQGLEGDVQYFKDKLNKKNIKLERFREKEEESAKYISELKTNLKALEEKS